MTDERKNPLKVGDIIYPEILHRGIHVKIHPIKLFDYDDGRTFTTAIKTCLVHDHEFFKPWKPENWLGWMGEVYPRHGIKIFIENNPSPGFLMETHAIRIKKVFQRSALGELIEIRVKPKGEVK